MSSDSGRKIVHAAQLEAALARTARPLVFTNGCFDILHSGHTAHLEKAAALGGNMLVALNTDASVVRLGKGPGRPFNTLADRMAVIAALACVSLVTWFDEDTPLALIKRVRPEHLVKGGEWRAETIVGAAEVRSWQGQVHSIRGSETHSTTRLIEKIRGLD